MQASIHHGFGRQLIAHLAGEVRVEEVDFAQFFLNQFLFLIICLARKAGLKGVTEQIIGLLDQIRGSDATFLHGGFPNPAESFFDFGLCIELFDQVFELPPTGSQDFASLGVRNLAGILIQFGQHFHGFIQLPLVRTLGCHLEFCRHQLFAFAGEFASDGLHPGIAHLHPDWLGTCGTGQLVGRVDFSELDGIGGGGGNVYPGQLQALTDQLVEFSQQGLCFGPADFDNLSFACGGIDPGGDLNLVLRPGCLQSALDIGFEIRSLDRTRGIDNLVGFVIL
ncbi:MAG: hypothetical protein ACAI44_11710 [Candidatus Sericytochromatia bacterium]